MSFLLDLLRQVGLGGSAVASATALLVAFYLLRARSVGARAASAGAALVAYSVAILLVIAVTLALGWFDPRPSVITEHLARAASAGADRATEPFRRLVRWLVDALVVVS